MARNKGDKDYSAREKQMIVSLIHDYSLFGATDDEMIQMLSLKLGKEDNQKISETLFYRLKKEAVKRRGDSDQWLDYYAKYQYIEYYRKRMEELEYVQRKLLEALTYEIEKSENKKNKLLINQLSKTIGENSKVLAEFGFAPPLLSRIKSLISENYDAQRNEEIRRIKILHQNTKSGFYLKMDNKDDNEFLESDDAQAVF